jgi:hypothetical protein
MAEFDEVRESAAKILREREKTDITVTNISISSSEIQPPVYRVTAALRKTPNVADLSIGLDGKGRLIDLDALSAKHGRDIFKRADLTSINKSALRPAQAGSAPVTVDPPTNDLTLTLGDTVREIIRVFVPRDSSVPKVDVYFLADLTGSMVQIIQNVQASLNTILSNISSLSLDVAFGVGGYRDYPDTDPPFLHQLSLTTDTAAAAAAINAWTVDGGSDIPEGQLYALDRIAEDANGQIGWRLNARRIVVWFGDAPGHEPICQALTGFSYDITMLQVLGKLVRNQITVVAVSAATGSMTDLNADPTANAVDYRASCGDPGGMSGQADTIAAATLGAHVTGVNPTDIIDAIIDVVGTSLVINDVRLDPTDRVERFIDSISPSRYGPLPGTMDHTLEFTVEFSGVEPCADMERVFEGDIAVIVDGNNRATKSLRVTVPKCPPPPVEVESSPSAIASDPARTVAGFSQISVFVRGDSGQLLRCFSNGDPQVSASWAWEDRGRPGGSGGTRIDGTPSATPASSSPAINDPDDFHVFVKGTDSDLHEIFHDGLAWQTWADHGDPWTVNSVLADAPTAAPVRTSGVYDENEPTSLGTYDKPTAFIWATDGGLWSFYQIWRPHGRPFNADLASSPGLLTTFDPFEYAFVVGNDGDLYVNYSENTRGTSWVWRRLGRPAQNTGLVYFRRPATVAFANTINTFVSATDGALKVNMWPGIYVSGFVTGRVPFPPATWTDLGPPGPGIRVRSVASALTFDTGSVSRVYAFVRCSDQHLWVSHRSVGATVAMWTDLGTPSNVALRGDPSAVVCSFAGSDPIYVFVRGADDLLYMCHINAFVTTSLWVRLS